jgi:Plavaka transposase
LLSTHWTMPPIRTPKKCDICNKEFRNSAGLANHQRQRRDHDGIDILQTQTIPSYTDPQFDRINSRNHDPEWDTPPSFLDEGSNVGAGDVEDKVDEGSSDQIFEGAGGPPSIMLSPLGEPNETGPRIPSPREEARVQFNVHRGDLKDGIHERRWYPYNSRQQFRIARRNVFPRIPSRDSIHANCVGKISDRLHPTELARRFESHNHFMSCLDVIATRVTPWRSGTLTVLGSERTYSIWHRDTADVLQELIGDVTIGAQMKWAPVARFDNDHNRVYTEMYTANWWWDQQDNLNKKVPEGGSKTIIPLILSSDKTVYGALSGDAYGWPLYLSVGNIPSQRRWKPTRPHWRVIAFIKDPQGHNSRANSADSRAH